MFRSRLFWGSFAVVGLFALGKFLYSCFCRYRQFDICEDVDSEDGKNKLENNKKEVLI